MYPGYSSVLLQHAKELFDFGTLCPGDYISDGTSVSIVQRDVEIDI